MIWKEECPRHCIPKRVPFYRKYGYVKRDYAKHPNYKSPYEIQKMLLQLTGYKWVSITNCSPDKKGWEKLGRVLAYYKWLADCNDDPGCEFTAPEKVEDMIMLPYAESSVCGILNSGDISNNNWSRWTRVGVKKVDPRTLRYMWENPPTHCCIFRCC